MTRLDIEERWMCEMNLLWRLIRNRVQSLVEKPLYWAYEKQLEKDVIAGQKPKHLGIILDGNRRFARLQNMGNVVNGHLHGAEKLRDMLQWCYEFEIPVITIWIFSMDNFQRDPEEVQGLFQLIEKKTRAWQTDPEIHEKRVQLRYSGRKELLPESLQEAIREAEACTAHYHDFILNIAIAYGGREEITDAFRCYMQQGLEQGLSLQEVHAQLSEKNLEQHLYTSGLPEPDFVIRTSGELRLSGFLLWQSAYAEYYFCDVLWPEFRRIDFLRALRSYALRKRRFGR